MRISAINPYNSLRPMAFSGNFNAADYYKVGDSTTQTFKVTPMNFAVYFDGTPLYKVLGTPSLLRAMELTEIALSQNKLPPERCMMGQEVLNLKHSGLAYDGDTFTVKNEITAADKNTITFHSVATTKKADKPVTIGEATIRMITAPRRLFEKFPSA